MNNLSITQRAKNAIMPSLMSAAVGTAAYYFIYGSIDVKLPYGPIQLAPHFAVGASVGIGTFVGEIGTQFVLPMVQGTSYQSMEEFIIPPALAGLGSFLALKTFVAGLGSLLALKTFVGGDEMMPIVLLGAGSSIGAKYLYGGLEGNKIVA